MTTPRRDRMLFGAAGAMEPIDPLCISRKRELDAVGKAIASELGIAVVFAPIKSGKTTFLKQVARSGLLRRTVGNRRLLSVRLIDYGLRRPDRFFHEMASRIRDSLNNLSRKPALRSGKRGRVARLLEDDALPTHGFEFSHWLIDLSRELGGGILVAVDEMAHVDRAGHLFEFLGAVRESSVEADVRWILASSLTSQVLRGARKQSGSVSSFRFVRVNLHDVPQAALVSNLRNELSERGCQVTRQAISFLVKETGGFAYLAHSVLTRCLSAAADGTTPRLTDLRRIRTILAAFADDADQRVFVVPKAELLAEPQLRSAFRKVCASWKGCQFDHEMRQKLFMLGLVTFAGERVCLRAPVFRTCDPRRTFPKPKPEARRGSMVVTLDRMKEFKEMVESRYAGKINKEETGRGFLQAYVEGLQSGVGLHSKSHREQLSGRGLIDLSISPNGHRILFETKMWRGKASYEDGLVQLRRYIESERPHRSYYVVFDNSRDRPRRPGNRAVSRKKIGPHSVFVVFIWVGGTPPSKAASAARSPKRR